MSNSTYEYFDISGEVYFLEAMVFFNVIFTQKNAKPGIDIDGLYVPNPISNRHRRNVQYKMITLLLD